MSGEKIVIRAILEMEEKSLKQKKKKRLSVKGRCKRNYWSGMHSNCQRTCGTKLVQTFQGRWHQSQRQTKIRETCCGRYGITWNGKIMSWHKHCRQNLAHHKALLHKLSLVNWGWNTWNAKYSKTLRSTFIYIYIYIYIYICVCVYIYIYIYILHGTVCDCGFHAISNRHIYVCIYVYLKSCDTTKQSVDDNEFMYICIYMLMYLSIYIYLYICIHTLIYIYIYIYINIYIYKVGEDCGYPKNDCSMLGFLIQNVLAEQNIYFSVKKQEN